METQNLKERELVEGCVAFKRQHQEIFYRKFANKMFNVCLMYTKNDDEAADIMQEAFIKIFRNISSFKFEGSLEGWVRRIMVNTAIEHYRKKQKEIENNKEYSYIKDDEIANPISDYEVEHLRTMINALPSKAQIVLKLFAVEGYGHKEIAELMNITEGTSKSQLSRAKALLKEAITKQNVRF